MDTGINLPVSTNLNRCNPSLDKDFTGYGLHDVDGHGTNIANIIADRTVGTDSCIIIVKFFDKRMDTMNKTGELTQSLRKAYEYVITLNPFIINMSFAGDGPIPGEKEAVLTLLNNKTYVIAAAGNNKRKITKKECTIYPACIDDRVIVVGNTTSDLTNYGDRVNVWIDGSNITAGGITMTGTSQAAAIYTATVVKRGKK